MGRCLNATKITEKINTTDIFTKHKLLSINQTKAQIKLSEVWKSLNDELYPLQWVKKHQPDFYDRRTRSSSTVKLAISRLTQLSSKTFMNAAAKIWNQAPQSIKDCKSIYSAKKLSKIMFWPYHSKWKCYKCCLNITPQSLRGRWHNITNFFFPLFIIKVLVLKNIWWNKLLLYYYYYYHFIFTIKIRVTWNTSWRIRICLKLILVIKIVQRSH